MKATGRLLAIMIAMGASSAEAGQRMTLVLAAPLADDPYYAAVYDEILDFQLGYARAVAAHDDVVILTDEEGYAFFARHLPESLLLRRPMPDIWARDYTTVTPTAPLRFRYGAAGQGGSQREADAVQADFLAMARALGLSFAKTDYILDGGNLVGDDEDKVIVTDRFLEDNGLSHDEGVAVLGELLGVSRVAIIPNDDPEGLAHADGMVMFGDPDTLFVTAYDEPFRAEVLGSLRAAFPDVTLVELPVGDPGEAVDPRFSSACGLYVNAVVTANAIYVPQFGDPLDAEALAIIRENTAKAVVPIPSRGVCAMGGSARCTVWQQAGANAAKLLAAAREG